jgi:hypothetical protein
MLRHFWDYLPYLGKILAMKHSDESMYSVIRDEETLEKRSRG